MVTSSWPSSPLHNAIIRPDTLADDTLEHQFASPSIVDTSPPKHQPSSPCSSSSVDATDSRPPSAQSIRAAVHTFFATRSRVVRLFNLPPSPETVLSAVFFPHLALRGRSLGYVPIPASLWGVRDDYPAAGPLVLWAVFSTHDDACAALSLSGLPFAVATALESDLEPFHKLKRFVLRPSLSPFPPSRSVIHLSHPSPMLRVSVSHPNLLSPSPTILVAEPGAQTPAEYYTLSTNPPNPKTSFRLGDWICPSPNCAAHNFGRNLSCIGCGCPKSSNNSPGQQQQQQQSQQPQQLYSSSNSVAQRPAASPRFSNPSNLSGPSRSPMPTNQPSLPSSFSQPQSSRPMGYQPQVSGPSKPAHPLLTPSGRAFAIGGRVQNISSDPLSPCIMYWPDNEPFPEQGQIRPGGLSGVPPPILNTGNKGPISHQPGDWICKKCNYLNWRRRKVCQTCLPYAEGNGDSISAAVQAERIALLTSVLAQTELSQNTVGSNLMSQAQQPVPRTDSMTPPMGRRPYLELSGSPLPSQAVGNRLAPQPQNRTVYKSQSQNQLGSQFVSHIQAPPVSPPYSASSPIYQTSGHRQPSPLYSTGPSKLQGLAPDGQQRQHHTPSPALPRSPPLEHKIETPAPLLPSFLQDIVKSPSLSPTSTATTTVSSDLPFEDEYEQVMNSRHTFPRIRGASESRSVAGSSDGGSTSSATQSSNIWRLDGEESKNLLGFPLPNQQDLMGGSSGPGVIGSGRKSHQPKPPTL